MSLKNHKGLGDTIAAITQATGLNKVVEKVAEIAGKEDCGCSKRREMLNKSVPYSPKVPPVPPPKQK